MAEFTLGQRLKLFRAARGISQKQLSHHLKFHPSLVSHIENGRRLPAARSELEKWLDFLRVNGNERTDILRIYEQEQGTIKPHFHTVPKGKSLTWEEVRTLCAAHNLDTMAVAKAKFLAPVYLPREEVYKALEDFLISDARCLVLLGRSGVGKSNLLLAFEDEVRAAHPEIGVWMYDGARIDSIYPLQSLFLTHLNARMEPEDFSFPAWEDFEKFLYREKAVFIIVVDAVNENLTPAQLLVQIDIFAASLERGTCVKVIFSSRPETWRSLARQIRLTEPLYYRQKVNAPIGVELREFRQAERVDLAIQIKALTSDELPHAYEKYRNFFDLQTEYANLSSSIGQIIQDPLMLRFLAEIYQGKSLPEIIQPTRIYRAYLEAMTKSNRLLPQDVHLLEHELVPLMFLWSKNFLSETDLAQRLTKTNQPLFNLVFSTRLVGGVQENLSILNLMDAEILAPFTLDGEGILRFQHERFYEYFLGRHIYRAASPQTNRLQWYQQTFEKLQPTPFQWGALKQALLFEITEREPFLLCELLYQNELPVLRTLAVQALVEVGKEDLSLIQSVLAALVHIPPHYKKNGNNAILAALETARELEILEVLLEGLVNSQEIIRDYAMQQSFYLWEKHPDKGLEIIHKLLREIAPPHRFFSVPNTLRILPVAGQLTVFIFFNNYRFLVDEAQFRQFQALQKLWQPVLETLLYYTTEEQRQTTLGQRARPFLREIFLRLFIFFLLHIIRTPSIPTVGMNPKELEAFFSLTPARKEQARRLLRLSDPRETVQIQDFLPDIEGCVRTGDRLTGMMMEQGIKYHHFFRGENMLPHLKELFVLAMQQQPPNMVMASLLETGYTLADNLRRKVDAEALQVYEEMVYEFYDKVEGLFVQGLHGKYVANHFGRYVRLYFRLHSSIPHNMVTKYTKKVQAHPNSAFARHFLYDIQFLFDDEQLIWQGLEILKNTIHWDSPVNTHLLPILAKGRIINPHAIRWFFEEVEAPLDFRRQVEALHVSVKSSDLLRPYALDMGVDLLQIPELWREMRWLFNQAFSSSSIEQLLRALAKRVINWAYGGQVFTE